MIVQQLQSIYNNNNNKMQKNTKLNYESSFQNKSSYDFYGKFRVNV